MYHVLGIMGLELVRPVWAQVKPPSQWLPGLDPGGELPKAQGMDFIFKNLIPFLVSGGLFLVIVLSLIFLIIGGIMWMTSGGNKEGLEKARATVTYAIIGLVLGLGAFIIMGILGQFLGVNLLGS